MTLPSADEAAYGEVQRMMEAAPRYGLEFVLPRRLKSAQPFMSSDLIESL
jgi:hypothetical protein